jgi:DNA-binding XRE family transcriptional regulator
MNRQDAIELISKQFKLVRTEYNFSQEEMTEILGLSKKTLVQIEKGRQYSSWSHIIALCAMFQDSVILQNTLGGNPLEVLQTIAFNYYDWDKPKTLGGKVWWIEKEKENGFVLQQNIISRYYRILDQENYRWFSSFDWEFIYQQFQKIVLNGGENIEDKKIRFK